MDKRIWKLIDTCICITESLCCTPETNNIVNQLCSKKKKKTFGSLLPGESRLSPCFWMEDEAREGSVKRSTWCVQERRGSLWSLLGSQQTRERGQDFHYPGRSRKSQQKNWVPAFAPQTCAPIIRWWQPIWFCVCSWHWLCQAVAGSWLDETVTRREGLTYSMWEGGV